MIQSLPTRRSTDRLTTQLDFTPWIAPIDGGATASSLTCTAAVVTGIDPSPNAIVNASSLTSTSGQILGSLTLAGGVNGTVYIITCNVTMSTGNIYTMNLYQAVNDNAI